MSQLHLTFDGDVHRRDVRSLRRDSIRVWLAAVVLTLMMAGIFAVATRVTPETPPMQGFGLTALSPLYLP